MARPFRLSLLVAACLVAVAGCTGVPPAATPRQPRAGEPRIVLSEPPATVTTTMAGGLAEPHGIDFLPDGSALITQRISPDIVRVDPRHPGVTAIVGSLPDMDNTGDGGVLGIAVSLNFYELHYVFVYYSTAKDNRVVRFSYYANHLGAPRAIVTGIPKGATRNGGALLIGPNNVLYIGTGDAGRPELAQDEKSLAGKVLMVDMEGRSYNSPWGNAVWTKGHGNVTGLARNQAFEVFAAETGARGVDEINQLERGGNYGWDLVEGPLAGRDAMDPRLKGTREPKITFSLAGECTPQGLAFDAIGQLYVACLKTQQISRAGNKPAPMRGDMTGVRLGPFNRLWALTMDGRIVVLPVQQ